MFVKYFFLLLATERTKAEGQKFDKGWTDGLRIVLNSAVMSYQHYNFHQVPLSLSIYYCKCIVTWKIPIVIDLINVHDTFMYFWRYRKLKFHELEWKAIKVL